MFLQNYYIYYSTTNLYCKFSTATTMAPEVTFASEDVPGKNYAGPPAQDVPPSVEDAEMVDLAEEEEVSVPATQAPRFECASL